jgi:Phage integrase, N-terminal SAM-like domain
VNIFIQRLRQELVRRNYAGTTIHSYIKAVEHFEHHIGKPLDQVGPDDLRSYHAHLLGDRKLAVNTVVLNIMRVAERKCCLSGLRPGLRSVWLPMRLILRMESISIAWR